VLSIRTGSNKGVVNHFSIALSALKCLPSDSNFIINARMKIVAASSILPIVLIFLPADQVNAHGYISQPAATYKSNGKIQFYTGFNAEVDASVNAGFSGGVYNHGAEDNTASFTEHWAATGYSSLKEMCDPIATDYGWSDTSATPVDVSSMSEFWWQNDEYDEGFLESHHGPCELWIDSTRVWHYDDCRGSFPGYPAKIPTDYSSCKGNCLVSFYWLALHSSQWQIYSASRHDQWLQSHRTNAIHIVSRLRRASRGHHEPEWKRHSVLDDHGHDINCYFDDWRGGRLQRRPGRR
jgi:hypothetical protein